MDFFACTVGNGASYTEKLFG